MHICPIEIAAFLQSIPGIQYLIGCCVECCKMAHAHFTALLAVKKSN